MREKVDPYLRPLYDALYDLFGYEKIQRKIETGEIEIAPLAFMRGRTLKNSFAILDEAQNATLTQIKMFLTRIGENSKLVVNGDPSQVDLINKNHSGLIKSKQILKDIKEIKIIEFDHKDVVRHPLVSKIIQAYQKGEFKIKDLEWGKEQARRIQWIGDYFHYYKKRMFIAAMLNIFQNKTFKWEIFKRRLEHNSAKLKNQGSRNDFIVNIERIYNTGTAEKNKIRLELYDYKR